MLTPLAIWNGSNGVAATGIVSCSYTCSHGSQPSVAALVVEEASTDSVFNFGTLVITDGATAVTLKDCLIEEGQLADAKRNVIYRILDRRWRWRYFTVGGNYNSRDEHGRIRPITLKRLPELIAILLDAMDEKNWVMDPLPVIRDNALPSINWDNAIASQELEKLIQPYGFRIVYRPNVDTVALRLLGKGTPLPTGPGQGETQVGEGVQVPQAPLAITLLGAQTCYTAAFLLEAVGMEPNGEIKPIDQLSYKPAKGWTATAPPFYSNLTYPSRANIFGIKAASLTNLEYQDLAAECVYRWYRIQLLGPDRKPIKVDGFSDLEYDTDLLNAGNPRANLTDRLQVELLDRIYTNFADIRNIGSDFADDAKCYALYTRGDVNQWVRTRVNNQVDVPFTIDPEHWLVKFSKAMFATKPLKGTAAEQAQDEINGTVQEVGTIMPATIILVTSAHLRNDVTRPFNRYTHTIVGDPVNGVGEMILQREDVKYNYYRLYSPDYFLTPKGGQATVPAGEQQRKEDVDSQAENMCRVAKGQFDPRQTWQRHYDTIMAIDPDGLVQQISWTVGGMTALTVASSNTEHANYQPPFEDRQIREKLVLLNKWGTSIFDRFPKFK